MKVVIAHVDIIHGDTVNICQVTHRMRTSLHTRRETESSGVEDFSFNRREGDGRERREGEGEVTS